MRFLPDCDCCGDVFRFSLTGSSRQSHRACSDLSPADFCGSRILQITRLNVDRRKRIGRECSVSASGVLQ